jgi:hypothetical protein
MGENNGLHAVRQGCKFDIPLRHIQFPFDMILGIIRMYLVKAFRIFHNVSFSR